MGFSLFHAKEKFMKLLDFSARREAKYHAWDKQAQTGNLENIYRLISLYPMVEEKFYPLVFKWTLSQAYKGEDCRVLRQAAQMFEDGHGTSADAEQALTWYERTLSLHILQGADSPLSLEEENEIQQAIEQLRAQTHPQ